MLHQRGMQAKTHDQLVARYTLLREKSRRLSIGALSKKSLLSHVLATPQPRHGHEQSISSWMRKLLKLLEKADTSQLADHAPRLSPKIS